MLAGKTTFLFDLDGTLIASDNLHAMAYTECLRAWDNGAVERFSYDRVRGLSTVEALRRIGVDDAATLGRLVAAKQARYRALVAQGVLTLVPGAWELLCKLRGRCCRLLMVSGGSRASIDETLRSVGLCEVFGDRVISADDAGRGKPAPDLYATALSRYGLVVKNCVGIEDTEAGVMACQAPGLDCVLVGSRTSLGGVVVYPNLFALSDAI